MARCNFNPPRDSVRPIGELLYRALYLFRLFPRHECFVVDVTRYRSVGYPRNAGHVVYRYRLLSLHIGSLMYTFTSL